MPAQPAPLPAGTPEPLHLAALNPEQRIAVTAPAGPLLVLAGAGTGKTRVLTTRLAHLLLTGQAHPGEVMAVTFTNKAAREMGERVEALINRPVAGMWLGTFHALGARLLRRHAELVGLKPNFTILDADDQQRLTRQVLEAADLDTRRWPPRTLLALIQRWKDRAHTPQTVPQEEVTDFAMGRGVALYEAYQERLLSLNAADFGDLLLHGVTLLSTHEEVLEQYQRRFRAILVDEYQDTNVAQYLWLRLLARRHRNITCVGDDDQSIYSWRGAEVGNILRFEEDFEGAGVIRLERNYRSTGHILGAAAALIARNRDRLGKTLWTEDERGDRVRLAGLWDDQEEARFISDEVEAHRRSGGRLADCAVLVRAGFQTRALEERFIAIGLPYRVIGGPRFYERAEIKDAIAYLRLIHQPDDDLAFERIVNVPKRGLGETSLKTLRTAARAAETGLATAAGLLIGTDELKPRARTALGGFLQSVERWRNRVGNLRPRDLVETVLEESGYVAMWQNDKSPDAPGRLENLKELARALEEFETLEGFLDHVSLVMDQARDPDGDKLSVMTLHGAKGLEFDVVFLAGWEEGLFPSQRSLDEGGAKALEEERRLAHVGMTRARRRLTISFAANRRFYGQWGSSPPSRFVEELPAEHIEHLGRAETAPDMAELFDRRTLAPERFRTVRAPMIEGRAERVGPRQPGPKFAVGARIRHKLFGAGQIAAVEGDKLVIAFDTGETKRIMAGFVEPE